MKISAGNIPGTNTLYKNYLTAFDQVAEFYAHPYRGETAIASQAAQMEARPLDRRALGEVLREQNTRFGAGDKTFANIDKLVHDNALVIITGQQTGLFGGPLYVLYKALTAIKLVDRLGRQCERCFVPVFWLASDDADFAEVDHIDLQDKNHALHRLALQAQPPAGRPVSEFILPETISGLIDELDHLTQNSEFKPFLLDIIKQSYAPGTSLSDAFGRWLMTLLREFGIIFIDPSDARIRRLAAPVFEWEIREHSPSTTAVLASTQRLQQKHLPAQISIREGRLNVFYLDGRRHSLAFKNGSIHSTDGSLQFSHQELLALVQEHPERFSPNVVLRALTQDYIFPTVAYVAGPAEVSYFAQLKGVYERFGVPMPIIYPRKSLTLIEPSADRIMDKYHLSITDFWQNPEVLLTELARQAIPDDLSAELQRLKKRWSADLQSLEQAFDHLDHTLLPMLQNAEGRAIATLNHLEKKILQATKRKQETVRAQIMRVANSVYPHQTLQERVHNYTPWLFKYGPDLVERLYELLDVSSFEHQLIRL